MLLSHLIHRTIILEYHLVFVSYLNFPSHPPNAFCCFYFQTRIQVETCPILQGPALCYVTVLGSCSIGDTGLPETQPFRWHMPLEQRAGQNWEPGKGMWCEGMGRGRAWACGLSNSFSLQPWLHRGVHHQLPGAGPRAEPIQHLWGEVDTHNLGFALMIRGSQSLRTTVSHIQG